MAKTLNYKKGFKAGANSVDEGLPGWFGTLADMMTLLMAIFVLLVAIQRRCVEDQSLRSVCHLYRRLSRFNGRIWRLV